MQVDPRRARALAERALAAAAAEHDLEAEISARYALGWAQAVLGEARDGMSTLRAGIRIAEGHGDRRAAALLRRQLAVWLASDGQMRAAQREMATSLAFLTGRDRAESQVHRLDIHRRTQRADPGVHRQVSVDAARALRRFRREGDELWEARLLFNRGLLHLDRGELDQAESDVRRAHSLYLHAGAEPAAANVVAVVAGIAVLRGEIVACLRTLDEVPVALLPGQLRYNLDQCRVLALMQARLLPEARAAAEEYIDRLRGTGGGEFVASALLDLSSIAVMSGDPASGRRMAMSAMRSFVARAKPLNAALARSAALRAQLLAGDVTPRAMRSALAAAAMLEAGGWRHEAQRTRLLGVQIALAVGRLDAARQQLELARSLQARAIVTDRIELRHVCALLLIADGGLPAAERELEHGLRLLDEYRAALGAVELRASASGIGSELAHLGLAIAVESRQPAKVLKWGERLRANALRLPPVRPPADKQLRELQTELRRATADSRTSDQTRLEAAIRSRARIVEAAGGAPASLPDARDAGPLLGDRALVEYVDLDGALHALTLVDGRLALHDLGAASAAGELEWLRFAYRRLAAGRMTADQRAAGRANAETAATSLDQLLVQPLLPVIGEAPLVLVPTGVLHALPWSALPLLRRRPLVVAPSLAMWCELARRPTSRRRKTALVAGPRLRHAAREVREVDALRPGATVLHGKAGTAEATLAALDGAALAHLACHGHFRADSPLFSSLELADGPLNVYELQRLKRAPEVVVLSACDLALSQTHPGDELLGFAAALLGMGTRTIVASVVPVPDAAARRLMLAFHRDLLAGFAPAAALARAQAGAKTPGFICLGAG
jgi:tetratricopeptide (TPR) repeat protein